MKVKDGMSQVVLSVGPAHTLRQAARMMSTQTRRRRGRDLITTAPASAS